MTTSCADPEEKPGARQAINSRSELDRTNGIRETSFIHRVQALFDRASAVSRVDGGAFLGTLDTRLRWMRLVHAARCGRTAHGGNAASWVVTAASSLA
jgi:hypothetical protein